MVLRAGCGFCGSGSDLRGDPDGDVPVGGQAERGGGEHGEPFVFSEVLRCFSVHRCLLLQMTSVERVVEYTELQSEAPWEMQQRPPPDWPNKGLVTFDRVSFSYSDDSPLVLQSLNATFRPKEKV